MSVINIYKMAQVAAAKAIGKEVPGKLVTGVQIIGDMFKDIGRGENIFKSLWKGSQGLAKNSANVLSSAVGAGDVFKSKQLRNVVNDTTGGGLTPEMITSAVREGVKPPPHTHGPGLAFREPTTVNVPQAITTARKPALTFVNNFSREFPVTGLETGGLNALVQNKIDTIVKKAPEGAKVVGYERDVVPTGEVKRMEKKKPKPVVKSKAKPKAKPKATPAFTIV